MAVNICFPVYNINAVYNKFRVQLLYEKVAVKHHNKFWCKFATKRHTFSSIGKPRVSPLLFDEGTESAEVATSDIQLDEELEVPSIPQ